MKQHRSNISAALAIAVERQVDEIIAVARAKCALHSQLSGQRASARAFAEQEIVRELRRVGTARSAGLRVYNSSVQGVTNSNATSLTMITLLALGTFVAGVQARVWQICAVGAFLFLSVPGVGWLDQSPLLLAAVTCVVIACGGLLWWLKQSQSRPAIVPQSTATIPPNVSHGE